jgi:hypothetical protein
MEAELYINGVNALTGNRLVEPMTFGDAARVARGVKADRSAVAWLRSVWRKLNEPHLGLPLDIDPQDVGKAGWGVVFHCDESPEVKEALVPLIEHRRSMAADQSRVKVLEYRSGETRRTWLARHGVAAGSVLPAKVPYYLLFIGNPEAIPFAFRHQVGVEYAVGSLYFDTAAEYSAYVSALLRTEGRPLPSREALFFGVRHPFDAATQLSADQLVKPLIDGLAERYGFRTRGLLAEEATKAALLESLTPVRAAPPAFIFTATHGVAFPAGHPDQRSTQGALLCQDWPGFGLMSPDYYLAAADIPSRAELSGAITFHFACFSAGTPSHDRFLHQSGSTPRQLAENAFVAALPQRLLGSGALACIGHVERAWGCSIVVPGAGVQLLPFENAIGRILAGEPVGYALNDFFDRYAALSVTLSSLLEQISFGKQIPDHELASAWIARNDAEGYFLLGDPAYRLTPSYRSRAEGRHDSGAAAGSPEALSDNAD